MHYEDVHSVEELNQKITDYVAMGYKVKNRTANYSRLVKNDFSWGIFIILFLLLIIGAIIYWAVKSGNKDEIVIRVKENIPDNTISNVNKYCEKCGVAINSEKSKFCPECGTLIKKETKTKNSQKPINVDIYCPYCEYGIIRAETGKCDYCSKKLKTSDIANCPFCREKIAIGNEQCCNCGEYFEGEW